MVVVQSLDKNIRLNLIEVFMDLGLSEKLLGVRDKIEDFVFNKVEHVESEYHAEVSVGDLSLIHI